MHNIRITDEASAGVQRFSKAYAISADSFARTLEFATSLPDDVDIHRILFRPTRQEG